MSQDDLDQLFFQSTVGVQRASNPLFPTRRCRTRRKRTSSWLRWFLALRNQIAQGNRNTYFETRLWPLSAIPRMPTREQAKLEGAECPGGSETFATWLH